MKKNVRGEHEETYKMFIIIVDYNTINHAYSIIKRCKYTQSNSDEMQGWKEIMPPKRSIEFETQNKRKLVSDVGN